MSLFKTLSYIVKHPLNKGRSTRAILRFLRWQVGGRLVPGKVVYDWVHGARVIVRPGDTGFTSNIYCGLYEFAEMAYVLHVLDSEDLFIDVGANVGAYTILACAVRGARGYCFEPIHMTYERLVDNVRLNNMSDRVQCLNCGLSDSEGELTFTSAEDATNHVLAPGESARNTTSVPVVTLDSVVAHEMPSVMKIDVEGFETNVLRGATATLAKESLHSVILELNGSGSRYGFSDQSIVELMTGLGFGVFRYDPFSRRLSRDEDHLEGTGNVLFVRGAESVAQKVRNSQQFNIGSVLV